MQVPATPALRNKVVSFLKQDAGFENTPNVNVFVDTKGFLISYESPTTKVRGFGEDGNRAFENFVDNWERFASSKFHQSK